MKNNPFNEIPADFDFVKSEEAVLQFWQEFQIFDKSIQNRDKAKEYVFYDGPPFATGLPHYGHLLAGTIKDIVPRYWTMRGFKVNRNFGWDCHGLPIENEAAKDLMEKENLQLSGKYEIEKYGIAKFNEYCRSIVLKYTPEWERIVTRMGRWVDFKNDYKTMDLNFMESVWWVFKNLWDKDLIYQGYRVMPYSWKLSTPLSNFEAGENYQNIQDPAITIKFKTKADSYSDELIKILINDSNYSKKNIYFLAWTTTPWTLPSNLALAVGKDILYAVVTIDKSQPGEIFILAEDLIKNYSEFIKDKSLKTLGVLSGQHLATIKYQPLLPYFSEQANENCFSVYLSTHVTTGDGTGIVHIAPAFGEDDFNIAKINNLPILDPVDAEGNFSDVIKDFSGVNVKEADKGIIRKLKEEGKIFKHTTIVHNYPFCWRSNTPLIYKAISTWFIKVEKFRDKMVKNNNQIKWVPEKIGTNRFGNWLANARDWNISRNRYWGTPIPIWELQDDEQKNPNEKTTFVDNTTDANSSEQVPKFICLGSVKELEEKSSTKLDDIHSHFIDHLKIKINGATYKRIPEVFDCWFESGSMPYARKHYPFENKQLVEKNFPADFIAEGLDQTRGWFYTLTVLSTILFDKPAFKNVVVNGLILAADGSKMSKSKKNYPPPEKIINKYGADVLRAYLINSPVVRAEPLRFSEDGLVQIFRSVISPLWNSYAFFITYANLDGYLPGNNLTNSKNELDRWVISHFQILVQKININMEYNILFKVIPDIKDFIEDLTNWYIRRSRRRFWKTEKSEDKFFAYNTLYYILKEFSKIIAPFL